MAKKWSQLKREALTDQQIREVAALVQRDLLDMDLRELRALAGKSQQETAAVADMTQSELSRFERREDHLLSTLRRYVEALGGELEVVAVLGNKRIKLQGV